MTRTASARLVGHNYRHIGVTFGQPWERIDSPNPYVGKHRAHRVRMFSGAAGLIRAACDCEWVAVGRWDAIARAETHAFQHRATIDLGGVVGIEVERDELAAKLRAVEDWDDDWWGE